MQFLIKMAVKKTPHPLFHKSVRVELQIGKYRIRNKNKKSEKNIESCGDQFGRPVKTGEGPLQIFVATRVILIILCDHFKHLEAAGSNQKIMTAARIADDFEHGHSRI